MRRLSQRGFSLVELMIATGLVGLAGTMLIEFLMRHTDFVETTSMQGDVRARTHLAIGIMSRELRHGTRAAAGNPPNVLIPAAPNNTTMTVYVPADLDDDGDIIDAGGGIEWDPTPIVYQYDAAARQLRRTAGAQTRVVVSDVAAVTFADAAIDPGLGDDEVAFTLTLSASTPQGRTLSTTAGAVVKLRN